MTNTKKKHGNKMKLMSAIGMLTVSAAMLVSSTFAWFSMNRKVQASSMSVTAKSADPYLKISAQDPSADAFVDTLTSGTNWTIQTTVGTGDDVQDAKLKLIAPSAVNASTGAVSWVSNTSDDPTLAKSVSTQSDTNTAVTLNEGTAADGTLNATYRSSILTGTVGGLTDAYVLKQEFTFKNVSPTGAGSKLAIKSVDIEDSNASTTSDFYKSARILVVSEDGKYAVYSSEGLVTGANLYAMTGTAMTTETITSDGTAQSMQVLTDSLAANGGTYGITVYMYFDGNATEAYTNNAFDLNAVSASFEFVMADETSTI